MPDPRQHPRGNVRAGWNGVCTIRFDGDVLRRLLGLAPRFTRFERCSGRLIAYYALWVILRHR